MKKEDILFVFEQSQCRNVDEEKLLIVRNESSEQSTKKMKVMKYEEDFESFVKYSLPAKSRKPESLMSQDEMWKLLDRITWGTLSFQIDDIPYSVGINHIVLNNKIYFHCGMKGYKLKGIGQRASFFVVEDFGPGKKVGTHSFQSVFMIGTLKEVTDFETKKEALLQIVRHLAPIHPYNDQMPLRTCILEYDLEYMIGKSHIYE